MSRFKLLSAALFVGWCTGCAGMGATVLREPVTVVPTRTAGVTFVIVRPAHDVRPSSVQQPGDGGVVMPASDYILLCDARAMTGMQCAIPTEAALARYSYTPNVGPAPTHIDEGVGTLADLNITRANADDAAAANPTPAPALQAPVAAPESPPAMAPTQTPLMAPSPAPGSQPVTQ